MTLWTCCMMLELEGYTWHCNRHTFAARLVMADVDLRTVAQLMGVRRSR